MRPRLPTFVGLALLALLDVGVARAESAIYALDADHTYATFAIDHNGASVNRARFDEVAGSVRFDPVAKAGAVDLYVQVASVYSGSKGFDEHLLSPDLFDAARFPTLRFVSERLVFDGERLVEVPGRLTLLGARIRSRSRRAVSLLSQPAGQDRGLRRRLRGRDRPHPVGHELPGGQGHAQERAHHGDHRGVQAIGRISSPIGRLPACNMPG
jgi:hypothetical protein